MLKSVLEKVVESQSSEISDAKKSVKREILEEIDMSLPHAQVISGVRRCGKSTFMQQLMQREDKPFYFNFEDPRVLDFEVSDFKKLEDISDQTHGRCGAFFFDEIQNVDRWEVAIRSLVDRKKRVVLTGSNASLLSRDLGTRLTGRNIRNELFTFSYGEMLRLTKKRVGAGSFDHYMTEGGFPEYLKYGKKDILRTLFEDILARDIIVRHNIRSHKTLKEMALYLVTNAGKEFTYNSLAKTFDLGSANTASSFVSHLEDSYLIFTMPKFDYSLKKQQINPKKAYSIDVGLTNANSISFSEDRGRILENLVYLALRREHPEIYYYRGRKECDFLVKEGKKITHAIQACHELDEDNLERETQGLVEALEKFSLPEGLILTYDQEDEIRMNNKKIKVIPTWKWMAGP